MPQVAMTHDYHISVAYTSLNNFILVAGLVGFMVYHIAASGPFH